MTSILFLNHDCQTMSRSLLEDVCLQVNTVLEAILGEAVGISVESLSIENFVSANIIKAAQRKLGSSRGI